MTPEQRIAHLEAELAEARADLRRANETLRVMVETQARERAAEAERKAVRSARNARARSKASTETSHETRTETSQPPAPSSSPPPSFSLSPPSEPSPSILYPFSPASPPPPPSASQASAAAPPLVDDLPDATAFALEAQEPPAPAAKKPREVPPGEVLYMRLETIRGAECEAAGLPFVPSRWAYSRQNKDLGPIAKLPDGHEDQVRFQAAWSAFLEDPQARDLDEPFSLSYFWRMRSRYEGRGLKGAA